MSTENTTKESTPAAPLTCGFCDKTQMAVRKLIRGNNSVCICDECADVTMDILIEDMSGEERIAHAERILLEHVRKLPFGAPFAIARPLMESVIALGKGSPETCREVYSQCVRTGDVDAALSFVRMIQPHHRLADDAFQEGVLLEWLGAHDEALAAYNRAHPAGLVPTRRALVPVLRAIVSLRRGGVPPEHARSMESLAAELEIVMTQTKSDAPILEVCRRRLAMLRALIAWHCGDGARAESIVRQRLTTAGDDVLTCLLLADLLDARRDPQGAHAARARAIAVAHPEGTIAARVRAMMAQSFPR
jgi:hypothetical protein